MSILGSVSSTANQVEGSQSANNQAQLEDDLNQFLTLLVTQLENQDPLDPMDSTEFTSQLVQFASVEQQIYQNSNLETLVALQQETSISNMVDFIDKVIEVEGQDIPLENGQAEFTYTMPAGAKSASIIIRDSSGITVYEQDADTSSGQHTFNWDGRTNNGQTAEDGAYQAIVTGLDQQNNVLQISQTALGRVTGVGAQNGTTTLFLGDIEYPQTTIISVKEAPSTSTTTTTTE